MFISSKLLINAEISLASFIYDCIDTFYFSNEETQKIYNEYKILKVLPYLLMTDTDSILLQFIVIADKTRDLGEGETREVLLKLFQDKDIHKRLDLSSGFFEQFGKINESIRKQVGLYEFENIEHRTICAICANPTEYFELYGILCKVNKNIRELEKELREWILITMLTKFYTLTNLGKVRGNRFAKKNKKTRFQNRKCQ